MSLEKEDQKDQSSTSHTSGYQGSVEDEDYVCHVRRLPTSDKGDSDIPTLVVPKSLECLYEIGPDSSFGEDIEMQQRLAMEGEEETQKCGLKVVAFALVGSGIVIGAVLSLLAMRNNHRDNLGDD